MKITVLAFQVLNVNVPKEIVVRIIQKEDVINMTPVDIAIIISTIIFSLLFLWAFIIFIDKTTPRIICKRCGKAAEVTYVGNSYRFPFDGRCECGAAVVGNVADLVKV